MHAARRIHPLLILFPAVCGLVALYGCEQPLTHISGNEVAITAANFESEVLQSDLPVLVDFGASWCPPCRDLEPVMAHLSVNYQGRIVVGKVDVDEEQELTARYEVTAFPTILLFHDGEVIAKQVGYGGGASTSGLADLSGWVESHLPASAGS